MCRKITLILLMIAAFVPAMSQPKTAYGQSDPQAKEILDAVSKKFKTYKSVKADFVLKITDANDKVTDSKKGAAYLQGIKYHINIDNQELISDGKTTWNYNKETNEVQINNYEPDNSTITPSRLFTNFYDKEFLYHLLGESKEKGKTVENIEMTPLDKSKSFFKVILTIDKASKRMVRAKIFDKSGNHYVYEVQKFTPNAAITNAMFSFNAQAHPKAEVVDLR